MTNRENPAHVEQKLEMCMLTKMFEKHFDPMSRFNCGRCKGSIRSCTSLYPALLFVLLCILPLHAHAHPDLELRIQSITEEIENNPGVTRGCWYIAVSCT